MDQVKPLKTELDCPCGDPRTFLCVAGGICKPNPGCIRLLNKPSNVPLKKVYILLDSGGMLEG